MPRTSVANSAPHCHRTCDPRPEPSRVPRQRRLRGALPAPPLRRGDTRHLANQCASQGRLAREHCLPRHGRSGDGRTYLESLADRSARTHFRLDPRTPHAPRPGSPAAGPVLAKSRKTDNRSTAGAGSIPARAGLRFGRRRSRWSPCHSSSDCFLSSSLIELDL